VTVAGQRPYDVFTLLDEPLWRVLYVFHHLQERDARQALDARLARVDEGFMAALAFNKPIALEDELRRVKEEIAALDAPDAPDDTIARGLALAERMEQGRVLSDEALIS
jgi:hypothetical protein